VYTGVIAWFTGISKCSLVCRRTLICLQNCLYWSM